MKFVTIRDFRTHSARIQRELPAEKEMVLTSNGKPVAIMSSISENDLEETLAAIRRARAVLAVAMIQAASVKRGTDRITLREINAEIAAVPQKTPQTMKVVIDTNVIVSALLTPQGIPAEILGMMLGGTFELFVDERIIIEYEEVLAKKKFILNRLHVAFFMDHVKRSAIRVLAHPLTREFPDPSDEPFAQVAVAGGVEYLITGNTKHFPPHLLKGIMVVTPSQFLHLYRKRIAQK